MRKKCWVFLIPTKNASKISLDVGNRKLFLGDDVTCLNDLYINQHLYITSDDEIKEGDWCVDMMPDDEGIIRDVIYQHKKGLQYLDTSTKRKIIATTDRSLVTKIFSHFSQDLMKVSVYKDIHLPQPSESFIQKYIESYNKGEIIKEVMVEYDITDNLDDLIEAGYSGRDCLNEEYDFSYGVKVDPKDNTITIHTIKESWSREEVISTIKNYISETADCSNMYSKTVLDWCKENL